MTGVQAAPARVHREITARHRRARRRRPRGQRPRSARARGSRAQRPRGHPGRRLGPVANPTAFAVDARGRLWATTSPRPPRPDGAVVVVTRQGKPPTPVVTGISRPLGLAWRGSELFVSSFGRVDAYSGLRGSCSAATARC